MRQRRFRWERSAEGARADYDPAARPRRQQLAGHLVENGALYLTGRSALVSTGVRISGRIGLWEMPEDSYTEVDEPSDLVPVLTEIEQPSLNMVYAYPEELKSSKKVQLLRDFLLSKITKRSG